jgi:hypothetical protein
MFYLLLFFGLIAMAAGVFVIGFGVPIRETPFGASLLTSGSVAITGGFVVVGLAAVVRELQRVAQGLKGRPMPRPLRPLERKEGERKEGPEKRPGLPRIRIPSRPDGDAGQPAPVTGDAPPPGPPMRTPGPDWLRRAVAEIEAPSRAAEATPGEAESYHAEEERSEARSESRSEYRSESWPRDPAPEPAVPDKRPAGVQQNIFDMVWPSDRRRAEAGDKRAEPALDLPRPHDVRPPPVAPVAPPPLAPAPPAASGPSSRADRPLSILKSGVIDEMAYTLFTDGSIEAQMPDGTMRFASIDELRQHLEKHEG